MWRQQRWQHGFFGLVAGLGLVGLQSAMAFGAEVSSRSTKLLAFEMGFNKYFETAICEQALLTRIKPLREEWARLQVMMLTAESHRQMQAHLVTLWQTVLADMPGHQRPPFSGARFAELIRGGQLDPDRLATEVARRVIQSCPGTIVDFGKKPPDRAAELERTLLALFEVIAQSGDAPIAGRLHRFTDLTDLAATGESSDREAELARLIEIWKDGDLPYRYATPHRQPPQSCKSGEHQVPSVRHTLVDPVRKARVDLWELELHEADHHGASLPVEVETFLGLTRSWW